jgi:hypothetical protein
MVQQMMLYMMTEQVDLAQMTKLVTMVEGGHKAVHDTIKHVKQPAELIDKMKVEPVPPNARWMTCLTNWKR